MDMQATKLLPQKKNRLVQEKAPLKEDKYPSNELLLTRQAISFFKKVKNNIVY